MDKRAIIIAGPNGAGKTTFAREFLPHEADCPVFINADLIAAGLSPFRPESIAVKAGKLMIEAINECVRRGESFAIETTLSGRRYLRTIQIWKAEGYRVTLFFVSLPNVDLALTRVVDRVRQGGHNIPETVVRRRFDSGLENFQKFYKSTVDEWKHFDNSGDAPRLIASSDAL
jgi:predicted ABC-type ATPase